MADLDTANTEENLVDAPQTIVAQPQTAELVQPTQLAYLPAHAAKAAAVLRLSLGHLGLVPHRARRFPFRLALISMAGVKLVEARAWCARLALTCWNTVGQVTPFGDVVMIRGRAPADDGDAIVSAQHMMLATRFSAFRAACARRYAPTQILPSTQAK